MKGFSILSTTQHLLQFQAIDSIILLETQFTFQPLHSQTLIICLLYTSSKVLAPVKSRFCKNSSTLGIFFFFLFSLLVPADPGPMAGFVRERIQRKKRYIKHVQYSTLHLRSENKREFHTSKRFYFTNNFSIQKFMSQLTILTRKTLYKTLSSL